MIIILKYFIPLHIEFYTMKQIFTLSLSLFFVLLNAQTQISGKITSSTGEPLFGVNVSTDRLEGAVTDFDGNYVLDLKPGTITLKLSSIGFVSQQHQVTIAENKKMAIVLVVLAI